MFKFGLQQNQMTNAAQNQLKRTVSASLNLIILDIAGNPTGSGSGVLINFSGRHFLCTVEHNIDGNQKKVALLTGAREGKIHASVRPPSLSFLEALELNELSVEGLKDALSNLERAQAIDIAFTEIQPLTDLVQEQCAFKLKDGTVLEIPHGEKFVPNISTVPNITKNGKYSFSGRVRSGYNEAQEYFFQQQLVYGMKLSSLGRYLIKFDLGFAIGDQLDFKGCSGAPIFNQKGDLVALVASGDEDVNSHYMYGFRLDRMISYINMMYFNPSLDQALALGPPKKE